MKLELKFIPNLTETSVKIEAPSMTEEVQDILEKLKTINTPSKKALAGWKNEKIYILNFTDINFFFCENQKVYVSSDLGIYEVKYKLYELEDQFKNTAFIKISKSAIANIDKIKNLEMSFNGTMCINFKNGSKEFISRRYVSNIKNYLKLGGK